VAFVGKRRDSYRSWWEDLRTRDYLKYLLVYMRIILEWTSRKWNGKAWTGLI